MREALTALAGSALPTLMVLVGILLKRNDINRLDGRILPRLKARCGER